MIPVLLSRGYYFLGSGKMTNAIECSVTEELNGAFGMVLKFPLGTKPEPVIGSMIGAYVPVKSGNKTFEIFDCYKREVSEAGVVTMYANHISRRLANSVFTSQSVHADITYIKNNSTPLDVGYAYLVGTGGDDNVRVAIENPRSTLAALIGEDGSVRSLGYDLRFWTETPTTSAVENRDPTIVVDILSHRGSTTSGAMVMFGYNLVTVNQQDDQSATYNSIVPYFVRDDGTVKYVTGYYVTPSTPPIGRLKAIAYDCTQSFDTEPSEADMTTLARAILDTKRPWLTEPVIECDFNDDNVMLSGGPVYLGDTVSVKWLDAGINSDLRCISYEYDVLGEKHNKITLGQASSEFVATTTEVGGESSGKVLPATSAPQMDGTAATGTSDAYARADHVHPSDTSRVPLIVLTSMSANTSAALLSALNTDNAKIPTGVSILQLGNSSVSNRALMICSKINATLGRGYIVSSYAINGTTVTLGSSGWT